MNYTDGPTRKLICNLKRLRLKHGLSISELAHKTNISKTRLDKLENGQVRYISLTQLDRLCKVFNLNCISELITF